MINLSYNVQTLSDVKQAEIIEAFKSTSRYLDDLLNIDNPYFESMVNRICPPELQYNGLLSRRQIFAVLSKKNTGIIFLRILIFAVDDVREKSFRFFSAKFIELVAQFDFPSIEQMCREKLRPNE